MTTTSAARLLGLLLLVLGLAWLGVLLRGPEITYAPGDQSQAETRGDSVVRCGPVPHYVDGVRQEGPPQLEVVSGNLEIRDAADLATADVESGEPVLSTEQVSADCATVRAQRLALAWFPGLGAVAGLLLLVVPPGRVTRAAPPE